MATGVSNIQMDHPLFSRICMIAESKRIELGLTRKEFAKLVGFAYNHYVNLVSKSKPGISINAMFLVRLVELGVDPKSLFGK